VTVEYLGSLTMGECVPMGVLAQVKLTASLQLKLGELQAKLAALLALQVQLQVQLPSITAALDIVASLQISPPSLNLQISAVLALIAEIQVELASIQADLAFSAQLGLLFGSPGIHFYLYEGPSESFGPEMGSQVQTQLAGQRLAGVTMLASDAGGVAALRTLFAAAP